MHRTLIFVLLILPLVSVRLIAKPVNRKIYGKRVNCEHHYYAPYSIEYITSMCKNVNIRHVNMLFLPTCAAKIVAMYILRGAVRRFMCKYNTFMGYCQTNIVRFLCISSAVVVAAGC